MLQGLIVLDLHELQKPGEMGKNCEDSSCWISMNCRNLEKRRKQNLLRGLVVLDLHEEQPSYMFIRSCKCMGRLMASIAPTMADFLACNADFNMVARCLMLTTSETTTADITKPTNLGREHRSTWTSSKLQNKSIPNCPKTKHLSNISSTHPTLSSCEMLLCE